MRTDRRMEIEVRHAEWGKEAEGGIFLGKGGEKQNGNAREEDREVGVKYVPEKVEGEQIEVIEENKKGGEIGSEVTLEGDCT